jgi:hypothetical protein
LLGLPFRLFPKDFVRLADDKKPATRKWYMLLLCL